jgi:DNA protecting protein DprA
MANRNAARHTNMIPPDPEGDTPTTALPAQPAPELFEVGAAAKPARLPFEISLLALSTIDGLGRKGIAGLFRAFKGDLSKVWEAPAARLVAALIEAKTPGADGIVSAIQRGRNRYIDNGYAAFEDLDLRSVQILPFKELPKPLRSIPDPPLWLFVQGNPGALYQRPAVAVVGTRQPSQRGLSAAKQVAKLMGPYDVTLVSGLAEGIDAQAHYYSLSEGIVNVAFLGHGINTVFPAGTKRLRESIIQRDGAVATEYLPDEHYQKKFFVERNRLQAGLADVVIPVEANPKGGTAHTIRFARSFGRPVIGIRWPGANGLLDELGREGSPIIEIFTTAGSKQLDGIFRGLFPSLRKTYALASLERQMMREIDSRNVTATDLRRLAKAIRDKLKEV